MPIPSLPLELIGLIITALRFSCGDDDAARRSNGLAAALVCKAWHPFGVAVIWHTVKLDSPVKLSHLVQHAERFPHFPPLVKEVHLLPTPVSANDDLEESDSNSEPAEDRLHDLWPLCTHLEMLSAEKVPWLDYDELAVALPRLQSLKELDLEMRAVDYPNPIRLIPQIATLAHLSDLSLLVKLEGNDSPASKERTTPLRLRCLKSIAFVEPEAETAGARPFHHALFDRLDASTLHELTLTLYPTDVAVIDHLSHFPSLDYLVAAMPATPAALPLLDRLIHAAGAHPVLTILGVVGEMNAPSAHGRAAELCLPRVDNSSLSAFLAALPVSLGTLHITGFYLTASTPSSAALVDPDPERAIDRAVTILNLNAAGLVKARCIVPLQRQRQRDGEDILSDCTCVRSEGPDGESEWTAVVGREHQDGQDG
ncbi:hypothetical protein JCM10207_006377 [Rhodosporidiobolus poonsookiae]